MKRLLIIGAGGHGCSVAEAILAGSEFEVVGFLDDAYPDLGYVWSFPVLGKVTDFARFRDMFDCVFVAIGNNVLRRQICAELREAGLVLATVVHPRTIVSPSATIGTGVVVLAGAIIGTEALLGDGVIVNCSAVVDHNCWVGDFGHIGVNAAMAGGAVLGAGAFMQAGAILGYGTEIEPGQVLAPGEAVSS